MVVAKTIWLPVHTDGYVHWEALDGGDDDVVSDDRPVKPLASGWRWERFVISRADEGSD